MLFAAFNSRKIHKTYLTFLNTFAGFYRLNQGNIINSMDATAEYMPEPLKTILKRNIAIYKNSMKSEYECFNKIINEVGDKEFGKFFRFASMNSKYGGDFERALTKFREQGERLAAVEATKTASSVVGTIIILFMIGISLVLIFNAQWILKSLQLLGVHLQDG